MRRMPARDTDTSAPAASRTSQASRASQALTVVVTGALLALCLGLSSAAAEPSSRAVAAQAAGSSTSTAPVASTAPGGSVSDRVVTPPEGVQPIRRPHPSPAPPGPEQTSFDLGVSMLAMWSDWDEVDPLFARAAATGTRWMRIDTGWCSLEERGRGIISTWYQARLDHVVDLAQDNGIQLLVMVGCTPTWAGGQDYHQLPARPAEYQRAMTYLASRYAGRVAAWEIWNEPDCIGGCGLGSAEAYVPVLQAGYRGVKAGDPTATVVSGGISGNNLRWLTRMYAAGAAGYFDALGTHPYLTPTTAGPDAPGDGTYSISSVAAVHELMVANGDGDKEIWFTEFGWSTPGPVTDRPGVTAAAQGAYLAQSMDVIARYPYVGKAFWFMLRDRVDSSPYENHFGLLLRSGAPKPSYTSFTRAVGAIGLRVATDR